MMKTVLAGAMLLACCASVSLAADLPLRNVPPVFASTPPAFSWTGFYAGVNAGGVVDNATRVSLAGITAANRFSANSYAQGTYPSGHTSGFTGGGQIGANYQLGNNLVFGLEADAAYTDVDHTQDDPLPAGAGRVFRSRLDFLGTVRGRVGYAFDRVLVYGTGGFAYGQTHSSVALLNVANTVTRFGGAGSELQTGYAVGGGVEYALPSSALFAGFGSHVATLKAEYIHYDLGSTNVLAGSNPAVRTVGGYNARLATSGDLVRAGLNLKY